MRIPRRLSYTSRGTCVGMTSPSALERMRAHLKALFTIDKRE